MGKGEGHLIFGIQDVYINTDVLIPQQPKKKKKCTDVNWSSCQQNEIFQDAKNAIKIFV